MRCMLSVVFLLAVSVSTSMAQPPAWQEVETALGRKGAVQEDMLKVTFPRADLKVTVGDVPVEPGLALTSWIGFRKTGNMAMMMGDLVLLEREIPQVIAKLNAAGIAVTALHNHLLSESPTVRYLHFSASGDPKKLAEAMRSALSTTGTPMEAQTTAASQPPLIDWSKVEAILARTGQKKGNLIQFGFPRREKIKEQGMTIPPYLGTATAINMQVVGNKAATTGDFVLVADEVNPVIQALLGNNIAVTAIHSHMLHESPRLFFLHFWGYDEPEKLAKGLKAALDKTNSLK